MSSIHRLGVLAVAIAAANAAQADERLDTVRVISAAGYEQKITDAPASITVVSREDLERKRYGNLAEALEEVEGIDVRGNTGKTGGLNISIRGMPAEYTLILIDGRRQNTAGNVAPNGFGEYNTSFMPPLSAIERIEVIRGPMSTLYGSDAMGGVINIITRKVNEVWGGTLTHDYTIQEEREYGDSTSTSLYASGPVIPDHLGLTVRANVFKRDESDLKPTGDTDGSASLNSRGQSPVEGRVHSLGARLDLISLQDHELWFDFDLARQVYDNGTPDDRKLSNNDNANNWRGYDDELRFNREQFAIGHSSDLGFGRWESSLMRNETETVGRTIPFSRSPTDPNTNPLQLDGNGRPIPGQDSGINGRYVGDARELETTNYVFDTKLMTSIGESHFLTLGGQWWKAEMTDGIATSDFKQTTWSLFAEDEWRIVDDLTMTLGLRHDDHDAFGGHTSPRAYLVWNSTDYLTIKGGVSAGYKTPGVDQLHDGIVGVGAQGATISIGSPHLDPETSLSKELGLYFTAPSGMSLNATVFHNKFEDKITSGPGLPNCDFGADPNRPGCVSFGSKFSGQEFFGQQINLDEATTEGVELAATFPLADRWSLSMNYTYTDSEVRENGQANGKLSDTPRHMAHARLNWRTSERLNLWLRADYRGESRRFDGRTSDLTGQNRALYDAVGDLKAYQLFSLGGSWRATDSLTFNASIDNLLNEDFRKFKSYEYNGTTYYASEYSHFSRSTKGSVLDGRRLWLSVNLTF